MRKQILVIIIFLLTMANTAVAQQTHFDPPWNTPPEAGVNFTVKGIDNVPDIFGDINDPQLVIYGRQPVYGSR